MSSQAELKAAYDLEKKLFRDKSRRMHPDKNQGNPNAAEEFRAVWERWNKADFAYTVLADDFDRYNYDSVGKKLREAFKQAFDDHNNGITFKEMADQIRDRKERANIYERRKQTNQSHAAGEGELFLCLLLQHIHVLMASVFCIRYFI